MKVTRLNKTAFIMPERVVDTPFGKRVYTDAHYGRFDSDDDLIAELAGRICYDSFDLPNDKTKTNRGYLANIIKQRHFSVLEHASASFLVEGVSRSLLMEHRTHRHTSFSARSTRYVDESMSAFVVPPALRPYLEGLSGTDSDYTVRDELELLMSNARDTYALLNEFLISEGATRKEAREAAREVLPGMTETEYVVSANHHAWREVLGKRLPKGAAIEIRELHQEILGQLKEDAPNTYQDIETEF